MLTQPRSTFSKKSYDLHPTRLQIRKFTNILENL